MATVRTRRQRLGQHFLRDAATAHAIAAALAGEPARVLEIGPGRGALTGPLLERFGRVRAVELDGALAAGLAEAPERPPRPRGPPRRRARRRPRSPRGRWALAGGREPPLQRRHGDRAPPASPPRPVRGARRDGAARGRGAHGGAAGREEPRNVDARDRGLRLGRDALQRPAGTLRPAAEGELGCGPDRAPAGPGPGVGGPARPGARVGSRSPSGGRRSPTRWPRPPDRPDSRRRGRPPESTRVRGRRS